MLLRLSFKQKVTSPGGQSLKFMINKLTMALRRFPHLLKSTSSNIYNKVPFLIPSKNNSIRVEKKVNMKLDAIILAAVASADEDRKVPPRHPLQRLDRLVEFSEEIFNTGAFVHEWSPNNVDSDWVANWIRKFKVNGDRMKKAFTRGNQRCGFYDSEQ